MRWVTMTVMCALCSLCSGCATMAMTSAVASSGDPRAIALLPVGVLADLVGYAISGGKDRTRPVHAPPPDMSGWEDPDNWVADCSGPLMCADNRSFKCSGTPDDCYCECVLTDGGSLGIANVDASLLDDTGA